MSDDLRLARNMTDEQLRKWSHSLYFTGETQKPLQLIELQDLLSCLINARWLRLRALQKLLDLLLVYRLLWRLSLS